MHACRHRNAVVDAAGEPPLGASLTGPGPADAVVRECAATAEEKSGDAVAGVEVVCSARMAGDYVLSVFHMETGERLFGSPFAVRAAPSSESSTQGKIIFLLNSLDVTQINSQVEIHGPWQNSRPSRPCLPFWNLAERSEE